VLEIPLKLCQFCSQIAKIYRIKQFKMGMIMMKRVFLSNQIICTYIVLVIRTDATNRAAKVTTKMKLEYQTKLYKLGPTLFFFLRIRAAVGTPKIEPKRLLNLLTSLYFYTIELSHLLIS